MIERDVKGKEMKQDVNDFKQKEEGKVIENSKPLFVSVVVMGVLIIIGVVALITVIAHRVFNHVAHKDTLLAPSMASSLSQGNIVPLGTVAKLSLPLRKEQGEHIISMTSRPDGTLAIALASQNGGIRVLLWAPEQARLIAELGLGDGQ